MRTDLSGIYTRTMFVNITEPVLTEQEKASLEAQPVQLQEEISDAATVLGLNPKTFKARMKKLGITRPVCSKRHDAP